MSIAKKNTGSAQSTDLKALKEYLDNNVKEAIIAKEKILDGFTDILYKEDKTLPVTFLLVGDSASGKTYLSNVLADFFEKFESYSVMTLSMDKFTNYNQDMDIIGVSYGYSSSGPGKVTEQINYQPKTVLILENFDKAHHNIQNVFATMFDKGYLSDNFGFYPNRKKLDSEREPLSKDNYNSKQQHIVYDVDCKDVIVIITTSRGEKVYRKQQFIRDINSGKYTALEMLFQTMMEEHSSEKNSTLGFSPSLFSLLSTAYIIPLFPLGFGPVVSLVKEEIQKKKTVIERKNRIKVTIKNEDHIIKALVLSHGPHFDLRKILKNSPFILFDKITDLIRFENSIKLVHIEIETASALLIDDWVEQMSSEYILKEMFRKNLSLQLDIERKILKTEVQLTIKVHSELKKIIKASDLDETFVFNIPDVSFADIAGHRHAKLKLLEILTFLKNPRELQRYGVEIPKGMLLFGPPGTGKTMLAKAFANEADLPFISITGNDLLNIDTMKKVFRKASEYAPSIIFIDEIDSIGSRSDGKGKDIYINQFLTELNGFSDNPEEMVFVIAATNYRSKIDSAITRSGRLDLHVEIPVLDKEARRYFIERMLKKPTQGHIDVDKLVVFTAGMSGADLEKVSREASLDVLRQGKDGLTQNIIIERINILKYGERVLSASLDKTLQATAYHEAGHAVISKMLTPEIRIEQIVITPRNDSLGFVSFNMEEEFGNLTFEGIKNRICMALAGRCAQIHKFGQNGLDSGATNDIYKATRMAHTAIAIFAMDDEIGYVSTAKNENDVALEHIEEDVQKRLKILLKEQQTRTQSLVGTYWDKIEKVAQALIENEFMDEEQFLKVIQ